jgi:hypothetical protein
MPKTIDEDKDDDNEANVDDDDCGGLVVSGGVS